MSKKIIVYVFIFFLLINFVSTGGHLDSFDGGFYYLVAENMFLNHSIKLDPTSPGVQKLDYDYNIKNYLRVWVPNSYDDYVNGIKHPFYMPGGVLGPALAVPWYAISSVLKIEPTQFVPFFTNSVILSLTSLVLFLLGSELFSSRKIGFVIALVFSITSFIWPYNTSFFLQPAIALTLISSIYFLIRADKNNKIFNSALSGILLGLSVLIHPSSILLVPGFLAYGILKLRSYRPVVLFLTTTILTSLVQFVINYYKYGSFTNFGYGGFENASTHTDWMGLFGLLFSPGWGLIFYVPLAILLPLSFYKMYKVNKGLFMLSSYSFVVIWIFFGTQQTPFWSGFGCWGPRYFIPFLPLASISLGYLLVNMQRRSILWFSFIILSICGFIVNLLGSLVWYFTGYIYVWDLEGFVSKKNSFDYWTWVPQYSPIVEHVKVLVTNFGAQIPSPITKTIGCNVDIFTYCTGGITPVVILLILITILGFLILRNIKNTKIHHTEKS